MARKKAARKSSDPKVHTALFVLLQIEKARYGSHQKLISKWFWIDHLCHDISPLEESRTFIILPWRDLRLRDWEDHTCYFFTGYRRQQLIRIYNAFGFREECMKSNKRFLTVSNHHVNAGGYECKYRFHPEELFLFGMTRVRHGCSIKLLVNTVFGGYATRWSYGWPYFLIFLDERYDCILGHQGLMRYLKDFPRFADAIKRFVMKPKIHHRGGRKFRSPGLAAEPWPVAYFIDCSNTRSNVAFSGPDGDYEGAPRKLLYRWCNMALYTKFKKLHGLKVETILLPNGISTVGGPRACRHHDTGGMLRMSQLDTFLRLIQAREEQTYLGFGDLIYAAAWLRSFRTYFRSYKGGPPLTSYQKLCNAEYKAARERIEFSYQDRNNLCKICADPANFRLGKRHPYAMEQLRVCHLMTNIHNCLNGDKASSYKAFNIPPPKLEEYLNLEM